MSGGGNGSGGGAPGVWRATLIGAACGLRSQAGPAGVALTAREGDPGGAALTSTWTRAGTVAAAVGEAVGDKLPTAPDRLGAPGLAPRLLLGGATGWALAERERARTEGDGGTHEEAYQYAADGDEITRSAPDARPALIGAAVGAAAAAAAAFAGARWRRIAADRGWPDWPFALVEDAVTAAAVYAAVRDRDSAAARDPWRAETLFEGSYAAREVDADIRPDAYHQPGG
ncbi:hypothetical protein [Streptomyces sp. ODS05-4]|uniref:hypothetical protein n=1 Tax=Streptomyces sp. ODS05-4 TaxID=2944939 RepID=UPI00210D3F90|nr:hypothetical protein [Streptomyces sp. ODS05-4]